MGILDLVLCLNNFRLVLQVPTLGRSFMALHSLNRAYSVLVVIFSFFGISSFQVPTLGRVRPLIPTNSPYILYSILILGFSFFKFQRLGDLVSILVLLRVCDLF